MTQCANTKIYYYYYYERYLHKKKKILLLDSLPGVYNYITPIDTWS